MRNRDTKNSGLDWTPDDRQAPNAQQAQDHAFKDDTWSGMIHPRSMLAFLRRRLGTISIVAAIVFGLGLLAFTLLPAKYSATATIIVDPRQQRITLSENVLSGIAGDAATLTSYVQIMNSDSFLSKLVTDLNVKSDPAFSSAANQQELVQAFRKSMYAQRRGATYLVDVTFTSKSAENAAKYANAIANAFVDGQSSQRSGANEDASQWLSGRLALLKANLKKSEDAVAAYRAKNGIIDTGNQNTVDSQQLNALITQLGAATTEVEDTKARYQQAKRDGVPASASSTQTGTFTNLDQLMQEQNRLRREAATLNQTLGARHPSVLANKQQQTIIAGQISRERNRLVQRTEQTYKAAKAKKASLERQLVDARRRAVQLNKASVQLAALERQAAADRKIYEDRLQRFKDTDEQRNLQISEAKIASAAAVPLKSNKASIKLVGSVLLILSIICGLIAALLQEAFARPVPDQSLAPARRQPEPEQYSEQDEDHDAEDDLGSAPPQRGTRRAPKHRRHRPVRHDAYSTAKDHGSQEREDITDQEYDQDYDQGREQGQAARFVTLRDLMHASNQEHPRPNTKHKRRRARADLMQASRKAARQDESEFGYTRPDEQSPFVLNLAQAREDGKRRPAKRYAASNISNLGQNLSRWDVELHRLLENNIREIENFLMQDLENGSVSILVTAIQDGDGPAITTDLLKEFAVELGERPVIISLQDQQRGNEAVAKTGLEEWDDHDEITMTLPVYNKKQSRGRRIKQNALLAPEVQGLIDMCKDNYAFVIVEEPHPTEPEELEELLALCDTTLVVLDSGILNSRDLQDWQSWALETGSGLVLDRVSA